MYLSSLLSCMWYFLVFWSLWSLSLNYGVLGLIVSFPVLLELHLSQYIDSMLE